MDINAKYRPKTFDEVLGHRSVVKSLRNVLKGDLLPHAFMFSGPAGVGKTSLARILAEALGVKPYNVIEQDALTHSSNEEMKELIATMRYPAMGGNPYRAVILDEVHSLSKTIWQTILKDIEEPPAHLFWILCTTEYSKLPDTLMTRMHHYALKPISSEEILKHLHDIRTKENFSVSSESLRKIADKSGGSVRLALALLSSVRDTGSDAEVDDLLEDAMSPAIKELCVSLCADKPDFTKALEVLRGLVGENVETIRRNVLWYATRKFFLMKPAETVSLSYRLILEHYSEPLHTEDGLAPFVRQLLAHESALSILNDGLG